MGAGEEAEPHSAVFFGPLRDFWWNLDHLELCARRIGLDDVRSVLDVGCGIGHWGRLLGRVLAPEAHVVGVDPEPRWLEEAARRAAAEGLADRLTYREGRVESLPFDDASFDLVSCQTLLMHIADPHAAIREMLRVTKHGGVLVVAEPNNRSVPLMGTSESEDVSVDERLQGVRFALLLERGKSALGEGNSSIGELVPRYFAEEGLEEIQVYISDKAWLMMPPYASDEARALKQTYLEEAERGTWAATRDDALRYYLAGGGDEREFDDDWERQAAEHSRITTAIKANTFSAAGGRIVYLVAGRRPIEGPGAPDR